jgi:hypothetical protein
MSDRLEYSGDPLPSGLPGFGGGTVDVLILPGFNRVVAPQKFGPVNNAPTVTPPDPTPPPGSNPEIPTPEVVPPSPAPTPPSTGSNSFCKACTPPTSDVKDNPLLFGRAFDTGCTSCAGTKVGQVTWFDTASNGSEGIFLYQGVQGLEGKGESNWKIDSSQSRAKLFLDDLEITSVRGGGPILIGPNGNEYAPTQLRVCDGNTTKVWSVLAYTGT